VAKKFTILVIPEGTNRVNRFSLPRIVLPLVLALVIGAVGMAGYWFNQYDTLRADLPDLHNLQEQNRRQEAQIDSFATRLSEFKQQMAKLKSFNRRLRVMANLEKPSSSDDVFGVGGPEVHQGGSGVKLTNTIGRTPRLDYAARPGSDDRRSRGRTQHPERAGQIPERNATRCWHPLPPSGRCTAG
jgi:hypothetical protein